MTRIALVVVLCAACGGAGSVEPALAAGDVPAALRVYRAERGHEALRRIAEHVLVADARAADLETSARACAVLRGLGAAALPAWDALEHEPGDHHVERVRAHALAARSALGDAPARRALRALRSHDDPEVVALAVAALDAGDDIDLLRALASDPSASVRNAAVQQLARAAAEAATLDVLNARARVDPSASVRASAARALVAQGEPAIATLEALSDEQAPTKPEARAKQATLAAPAQASATLDNERVRAAALGALAQLAKDRALPRLAALLAGGPSQLSLQVAQDVLARPRALDPSLERTALAHVAQALAHGAAKDVVTARLLRERAALAASVAAAHPAARERLLPAIEAQLAVERDRPARLLLALSKQRLVPDREVPELVALARGEDVVAAQAAGELAPYDPKARERLSALVASRDAVVRATAGAASAATLDFERAPARAASLRALADPEPRVHAPAAAAVLRALERLRSATSR